MTTNNMRICPYNFFDNATLVETPTMLTTMPSTNMQLTARDKTARSVGAASVTQTIQGTWADGLARIIDSFFIFQHNCQGGSIRLRLFANANYTGTTQDTTTLAFPSPITSLGFDFGFPASSPDSSNDPLFASAPYSLFFSAFSAKSFQIDFTSGVRSYWDIGRIFLGKYVEAPFNPRYGLTITEANNDVQVRTKGASLRTRPGYDWREFKIDTFVLTVGDRALWRDLVKILKMSGNFAFSLYPNLGGRDERDHIANAQFIASSTFNKAFYSQTDLSYSFGEV